MRMKLTKHETAYAVVELIKNYFTGNCLPYTIGISDDGEIGRWYDHDVWSECDMFAYITDVASGWVWGDFDGDITNEDDWADNHKWLVELFRDEWIDEQLDRQGITLELEWPEF